jgi:hypothetical protein
MGIVTICGHFIIIRVLWQSENFFTLYLGTYFFDSYPLIIISWHIQSLLHIVVCLLMSKIKLLHIHPWTHLKFLIYFLLQLQMLQHLEIFLKLHFILIKIQKVKLRLCPNTTFFLVVKQRKCWLVSKNNSLWKTHICELKNTWMLPT